MLLTRCPRGGVISLWLLRFAQVASEEALGRAAAECCS